MHFKLHTHSRGYASQIRKDGEMPNDGNDFVLQIMMVNVLLGLK